MRTVPGVVVLAIAVIALVAMLAVGGAALLLIQSLAEDGFTFFEAMLTVALLKLILINFDFSVSSN